jgi:hypothetical protein
MYSNDVIQIFFYIKQCLFSSVAEGYVETSGMYADREELQSTMLRVPEVQKPAQQHTSILSRLGSR